MWPSKQCAPTCLPLSDVFIVTRYKKRKGDRGAIGRPGRVVETVLGDEKRGSFLAQLRWNSRRRPTDVAYLSDHRCAYRFVLLIEGSRQALAGTSRHVIEQQIDLGQLPA